MKKKVYNTPVIKVVKIDVCDIICGSPDTRSLRLGGWDDDDTPQRTDHPGQDFPTIWGD